MLTDKTLSDLVSTVHQILRRFPSISDGGEEKFSKRELGLVKLLAHQEEVWEDFDTLADVATALYQVCENQQDLKLLADLDLYSTLNVMESIKIAEVTGMFVKIQRRQHS